MRQCDSSPLFHGTTVLAVKHKGHMAIGADGQVTFDDTVMKGYCG